MAGTRYETGRGGDGGTSWKGLGLFCEQRVGSLQEAIDVPSGHVGDKMMWCGFCSNWSLSEKRDGCFFCSSRPLQDRASFHAIASPFIHRYIPRPFLPHPPLFLIALLTHFYRCLSSSTPFNSKCLRHLHLQQMLWTSTLS